MSDLPCADLLEVLLLDAGIPVENPATGRTIAHVRDWPLADISAAIDRAEAAWAGWRALLAEQRGDILRAWYEAMIARREDLARLLNAEQGKVLTEARAEVDYGAGFAKWFAEEARRVYGDVIPAHGADKRIVAIKQPVGVVAAITPWNFPIAMITRKIAPALAVGCPVVVKPATATPLCALAIAELAYRAGVPREVLQVVTSSDAKGTGKLLCASPKVRKLSFTGSTPVGRTLIEWCAPTVKRLSMELGGNAPFIIFDDADLDAALKGLRVAKFRNNGQTCIAGNRILVQDGIYDAFMERFSAMVGALGVGDGEGAEIGPLIDAAAVRKVRELIADAEAKGATVTGGEAMDRPGHFIRPGIVRNATPEMDLAQEEIFGPLAPVFRFRTEDEAVALANATDVGLAGYFYSRDVARCWRVAEALEYGMVGVNEAAISNPAAPFGGIKQSGLGREGSKYGIEEYLEVKYLCFGGVA